MRIAVNGVCIVAAAMLSGCGNAYEKIAVGKWVEVGKPEAPGPTPVSPYVVNTTHAGTGPSIKAGDLVKARLQVVIPGKSTPPQDVWVWVGREPVLEPGTRRPTSASYAQLGSARFRGALIGRRLNEKFELRGVRNPQGTDLVPLHALLTGELPYNRLEKVVVSGRVMSSPAWPAVEIPAPLDTPDIVAEVEILQVCEARLYRRTALLRQWGIPFRFADMNPKDVRQGQLGWSLIDAQCPGAKARFKVQAGPFYDPYPQDEDALVNWSGSYVDLRPPSMFPEEWVADRARTGVK